MRHLLFVVLISLPLPLGAQKSSTRDSAGVRIIDNPPRLTVPVTFQIGPKPLLDVGGLETNPDDEFDSHQGYLRATRLANGGLAVIDVSRVQYFDARGKRVRIAGRKGQGPEEFLYLTAICRTRGDTVVVSDANNHRLAVLDQSGKIVRTIPQADLGSAPFDFCFEDGTILLEKFLPSSPGAEHYIQLNRVRLDGTLANSLGTFSGGTFDMVTQHEATWAPTGQRVFFGTGQRPEVGVLSNTGKLIQSVRTADPLAKITDAEAEGRMAGTIPTNVSADERKQRMERMRSMPHATTWPAYSRLHVTPDGHLWVQDYRKTYPSPDTWTAFDPSGKLLGRLVIPTQPKGQRPLQVIGFGDREIVLRVNDEDGADHIMVFPILPAPK